MNSVKPGADKPFILSLLLSFVIIMTGMVWTWRVGQVSNNLAHHESHLDEGLDSLKKMVKKGAK